MGLFSCYRVYKPQLHQGVSYSLDDRIGLLYSHNQRTERYKEMATFPPRLHGGLSYAPKLLISGVQSSWCKRLLNAIF